MKLLFLVVVSCFLCLFFQDTHKRWSPLISDGSINPASASFIKKAISKAETENAECVIIHLNTPGGLLKSARQMSFKNPGVAGTGDSVCFSWRGSCRLRRSVYYNGGSYCGDGAEHEYRCCTSCFDAG